MPHRDLDDYFKSESITGKDRLELDDDVTFAVGNAAFEEPGLIAVLIDGGGSAVAADTKVAFGPLPVGCRVTAAHARADAATTAVVDVWADDDWIPTDADSITASAPITLTADDESDDATLTGWARTLSADSYLIFNVDSNDIATWLLVSLDVMKGVS